MTAQRREWPRTIVHADMDAFYASIEQLDDPTLRGRPLLVGPNSARGVVLTASYEARPFGVGSAMPMQRARRLCPQALIVPPRFERYQEVSQQVMGVFSAFSPQVEPLSLDEAFLDMTGSERLFGQPATIGGRIKAAIREATGGLTASVGISGTRYVAKIASGYRKPDGLTIVPPELAREWLAPLAVENLWGAGAKTSKRLREAGYQTIGQIAAADAKILSRLFGAMGERFYAIANAVDPRTVSTARSARSLGSERTLAEDVSSPRELRLYLRAAAETVAQRLRRRSMVASGVRIKLKRADFQILTRQDTLAAATDVSAVLATKAAELLAHVEDPGPFRLVGLAVFDIALASAESQLSLLPTAGKRDRVLETAIDALENRFGAGVVQRGGELFGDRGVGVAANLDFLDTDD
ncbi:MAG: DNA polymerase IV [Gammaproteobacteria bacterium]